MRRSNDVRMTGFDRVLWWMGFASMVVFCLIAAGRYLNAGDTSVPVAVLPAFGFYAVLHSRMEGKVRKLREDLSGGNRSDDAVGEG